MDIEQQTLFTAIARAIWPKAADPEKQTLFRLLQAVQEGHLCIRDRSLHALPPGLVRDSDRLYLQRHWMLETTILSELSRLESSTPADLFDKERCHLDPQLLPPQAEAIRSALQSSLTVVSGGPGTGKTFTAGQLIHTLAHAVRKPPLRVKIAAPTGKAVDRLFQGIQDKELLEVEAVTLHRLLKLRPGKERLFQPARIEADLILVDEASMIDAMLFAHLFASIPTGARLVLLGDADQLPPIGGGGIFKELSAIRLERSLRVQNPELHALFDAVRQGTIGPLLDLLEPLGEERIPFSCPVFESRPDPQELFARFDRFRWICPLRRGPLGVDAINQRLLQKIREQFRRGGWWAAPLLLTANDPTLQLTNGMPAVAIGCEEPLSGRERVYLQDGREFSLLELPGYELAFALSAHKSQGSEYEEVLCWMPPGSEEFGRAALYTALTRAKRSVRIAAEKETIEKMLSLESRQENGLRDRRSMNF